MAVNLKATATLNGKPFLGTLKTLSSATANLNTETAKGNATNAKGLDGLISQHERASKVATAGAEKVNQSYQKTNKTFKQGTVDLGAYATSLDSVQRTARGVTAEYSKMTPAIARLTDAKENLAKSEKRLARETAQGLEGPAYDKLHERVIRDAKAVGKAQATIERELNSSLNKQASVRDASRLAAERRVTTALDTLSKQQATDRLNSEKQLNKSLDTLGKQRATERIATEKQLNKALDAERTRQNVARGAANAASFKQGLASMSAEEAVLAQARNRVLSAEQGLAKAYTSGNGIAAAESGLIRAEQGYRKLAAAQEAVAKGTKPLGSGLAAQRYLYHDVSRQAAGLGIAMAAIPAMAIGVGAVWENKFADVLRTSDPVVRGSEVRINALRTSLVGMAKTMPIAFGDITEIATLGNQMGVASHELEGFTKSVAMFSATSGISVEEASTAFGRLRTVASDANFSFMGVADSILKVGVNSVATEQEIINVTTQISSIAASAGFSTEEMIGLSGALASVRVPPELSRSIITRTFGQFDSAVQKNGTELQTLARVSGRTVEDIKKNWGGPGAANIFTDFVTGLQKSGRQAREELKAIGITSVRDVPALMRLANAADSTGKKGGLLTQTIEDARNASGEVQGQYAIMAETVIGKLKVLGNSVLSFFNSLGASSNSFVTGAIEGLTNMFQFMDKIVDNPFSSWALGAMAAVSGIALATAGLAKLTAGIKMFQHVGSVVGAGSFMSAIGMTKKGGGGADMSPILAGSAALINNFKTGVKSAGATWKNFGNTIASTASWVVADRHIKNTGLGFRTLGDSIKAGTREIPAATGMMGNFARTALHPVTLGLAAVATVGAIAYNDWSKGFHMVSTTTEDLAKNLSNVDMSNVGEISKVLRTVQISGTDVWQPWQKGFKPFADGLPGLLSDLNKYVEYNEKLAQIDAMGTHSKGGGAFGKQAQRDKLLSSGIDPAAFKKGLGNLDTALNDMRAAGNDASVMDFWARISQEAGGSAKSVKVMKDLMKDMPLEAEALTNQFDLQGISLDNGLRSVGRLSREFKDTAAGFDGMSIIADTFGLGEQEAVSFGKTLNDAASAFIDFNAAMEAGTKVDDAGVFQSFDLAAFDESLGKSMTAQNKWMNNMRSLVTETAPDVIEAMGSMGPAGKELANSLVEGLSSSDASVRAQAEATLKTFEDAVYSSKIDFGPHLAEYNNVVTKAGAWLGKDAGVALNAQLAAGLKPEDWTSLSSGVTALVDQHGPELGGRLGKRLFENLNAGEINVEQFSTLSEAFGAIGYNASKSLMDALGRGVSMDEVLSRISRIQNPKIPVEFEPGSDADTKITGAFKDMFGANGVEIPANFNLDMTMESLREALNMTGRDGTSRLLPDIEAELTLNDIIAQGQVNGFRAWAMAQGIDVELLANPSAAYLTLDSFKMVADGTVTTAQLDALNEPAKGKLYEFITLASGKTAVATVDAETGLATGKIWELDTEGGKEIWKPIDAKTGDAKAAIEEIDAAAEAKKTKNITVTDNGTAAAVGAAIDTAARNRVSTITVNEVKGSTVSKEQANGGVMQFYANGGVRENHVAQIAPAGTMRVWAEAETGGEAYIPLAQSKRLRSEAILNDVANRFGYTLQPQNYTRFADGGQYMAQRFAQTSTQSGSQATKQINMGGIVFQADSEKNQLREFERSFKRVVRRI